MKKSSEKTLGLNPKQYLFLATFTKVKLEAAGIVAGRGFGKTYIMAIILAMMIDELPRARGGFGGRTIKSIKNVSISLILSVWKEVFGYTEYNPDDGGDYVLWKKPPDHFDRPYLEPEDWSNCITWSNGWCLELEGFKLSSLENRGKNFDFYLIDEFAFFKEEWLKIVLPTIRANVGKYSSNYHHLFLFFTSPPLTSRGIHVWKYKELAKKHPDRYLFIHGKSEDNLMFLPSNYIQTLKDSLTKFEFEIEVEGKEIKKNERTYYPGLAERHYKYVEEGEAYYNPNSSIILSADFNAHFTCGTVYQRPAMHEHRCVGNVFVRESGNDTMAEALAHSFAKKYEFHRYKKLILTGDRNGKNKSAGSNKNMFQQIENILTSKEFNYGWTVEISALSNNKFHKERYILLNDIFSENGKSMHSITFDAIEAKSTLVSMEQTPIEPDYSKNKDSEKEGDQELATHLSDTVDYYLLWVIYGGTSIDDTDFEVDFF